MRDWNSGSIRGAWPLLMTLRGVAILLNYRIISAATLYPPKQRLRVRCIGGRIRAGRPRSPEIRSSDDLIDGNRSRRRRYAVRPQQPSFGDNWLMWICFNDGFVSVVSDKNNPDRLLVRARRKTGPVERLRQRCGSAQRRPSSSSRNRNSSHAWLVGLEGSSILKSLT